MMPKVDVWAVQPIWHPNIDLFSGKVSIPVDWSPVLTLNSIALGVQMIMLEPSSENPLNIEAYSYYMSNFAMYEMHAQSSLAGGSIISGVKFTRCLMDGGDDHGGDHDDGDGGDYSDATPAAVSSYQSHGISGKSSRKRTFHLDGHEGQDDDDDDDDEQDHRRLSRRQSSTKHSSSDRHHSSTTSSSHSGQHINQQQLSGQHQQQQQLSGQHQQQQPQQVEHSQQDEFERDIYVPYSQLSLQGCEGSYSRSISKAASTRTTPLYSICGLQETSRDDRGIAIKRPFNAVSTDYSNGLCSDSDAVADYTSIGLSSSSSGSPSARMLLSTLPTSSEASSKRFKPNEGSSSSSSSTNNNKIRDRMMVTAL
jgi:hypothetical protein